MDFTLLLFYNETVRNVRIMCSPVNWKHEREVNLK